MRLALFQPDIAQNAGSLMRLCACLGVAMDIIEPCGFVFSDRHLKRAGMDYMDKVDLTRHQSWDAFISSRALPSRIILMTIKTSGSYLDFAFRPGDILLAGSESAGVPADVHAVVDGSVTIPMQGNLRSLNVAIASAIILGEALRQTGHK